MSLVALTTMNLLQNETKSNQSVKSHKAVKAIKPIENNNKVLLEILFKNKPDSHFILVWRKEGKKRISNYFDNWQDAQKFAESKSSISECYFGLATTDKIRPADERIKANDVTGISSLFLDIDFKSEAHKKQNLPPNEQDALHLIKQMPVSPTIIVHSGHGFQAYYLFDEFIEINDEQTRIRIAELSEKWQRLIKEKAKVNNWDVDSTFDLARVFRVSNTLNHKIENDKPVVRVVKHSKKTYSLEELENLVGNVEIKPKSVSLTPDGKNNYDFELSKDAEPPKKKFEALAAEEPKFLLSWNRKRTDLQDESASSYDLSLATFAVIYGWTNQDIVNLLIASRKKHGDNLKLRYDYYARTLEIARNVHARNEMIATDETTDLRTPEEKRQDALELLTKKLRLKNLVKVGLRGETFEFHFTDKKIVLGSAENLYSQTKVISRLNLEKIKFDRKFKLIEWQEIVNAIIDSFEVIETHTDSQEIMDLVVRHIQKSLWREDSFDADDYSSKEDFDKAVDVIREKGLFDRKSITVYLSLSFFASWVNHPVRRYTQKELAALLGRNDFVYKQKTIRVTNQDGSSSTINLGRFYVSPKDYFKNEVNFLSKLEV